MAPFIALMIMQSADRSLEAGQDKYRAYFINTKIYERFRSDAEAILQAEGYGDCIVTE